MIDNRLSEILKNYWYAMVGAFFGAGLALLIDAYYKRRDRFRSAEELERVLREQVKLITLILAWLNQGMPNFKLDTQSINIWLIESGRFFDKDQKKAIGDFRYQLEHLNTKLELYYPVSWASSASTIAAGNLRRRLTLDRHLKDTKEAGEKLLLQLFHQ